MALYTKQQLKDAYFAKVETNSSAINDNAWFAAEIIKVQAQIDAQIATLSTRKAELIERVTVRAGEVQARIDAIEPVAKEKMKDIALAYIASQAAAQSETDNDSVDL